MSARALVMSVRWKQAWPVHLHQKFIKIIHDHTETPTRVSSVARQGITSDSGKTGAQRSSCRWRREQHTGGKHFHSVTGNEKPIIRGDRIGNRWYIRPWSVWRICPAATNLER